MDCPYCKKEMKAGIIQSPHEIAWLPEKPKLFGAAFLHKGSVVLAEHSYLKGSYVIAYNCEECKKIIIDYKEEQA